MMQTIKLCRDCRHSVVEAGLPELRCVHPKQYGDRKASEDAIAIVGALRVAYADALAALTPFAHKDLCQALGGNAEGDASRIFVRNSAVITLGDCRRARAIVVASETAEWGE